MIRICRKITKKKIDKEYMNYFNLMKKKTSQVFTVIIILHNHFNYYFVINNTHLLTWSQDFAYIVD